jgi:hypothetical protein
MRLTALLALTVLSLALLPALASALDSQSLTRAQVSVEQWSLWQAKAWGLYLLTLAVYAVLSSPRSPRLAQLARRLMLLCALACAPSFAFLLTQNDAHLAAVGAVASMGTLLLWLDQARALAAEVWWAASRMVRVP